MNIKLQLGNVRPLIDKRLSMEQISRELQPIADQAKLVFATRQIGVGNLQWSLPGSDWTPVPQGNEEEKATVAQIFSTRKALMQNALQGSPLKDAIFSVPSEDFVFFRRHGEEWEIALTAWGYKYLDKPATTDLDIFLTKNELQNVNVAFSWSGRTLPEYKFKLKQLPRVTSSDGFLHFDRPVPVGNSYSLETLAGQSFTLIVEKGKEDYVFDVTQYYHVNIQVSRDATPLHESTCEVQFNGDTQTLMTDVSGQIQIQMPLVCDAMGQPAIPQPPCIVTCEGENQQQVPSNEGCVLSFVFDFHTEKPVDKHVQVKIEVFRDATPVEGQMSEILFNGQSQKVTTNDKGEAFADIVLAQDETGGLTDPQPVCEAICGEEHQKQTPLDTMDSLLFRFELPKVKEEEKEPEYVFVELKDYGGVPLVDMPFVLTTKKKERMELRTDTDGKCKLPKEWFTPNEKMKIEFVVSPEYQETHDLHDPRNKKKQ
jgi:hypothetical protein